MRRGLQRSSVQFFQINRLTRRGTIRQSLLIIYKKWTKSMGQSYQINPYKLIIVFVVLFVRTIINYESRGRLAQWKNARFVNNFVFVRPRFESRVRQDFFARD